MLLSSSYLSICLLQRTQAITITSTISIARVPKTASKLVVRSTKEDKKGGSVSK